MTVTRADFLLYSSLAAGLLTQLGTSHASAPDDPESLLDSQRFRRAVEQGDLALVKSWLERDPALASSRDERGRSVFVLASLAGHDDIAEALRPHLGSLDLVEAILAGDAKRVAELVEAHPRSVNEIHPSGGSAVHMAVRRGRTDLLFAMLRPGPDFNLPSAAPEALTPLRLAVDHPGPALADELVDAMIGNGADPNVPQGDGVAPLQAAVRAGRTEIVRLLAFNGAEGADSRLPRNHRTSRFSYTADGGKFERPEQPAYPWPVINEYVAMSHGNLARMKELLDLYPKVLHANASWNELAVEAGAHVGAKDCVRFMLDHGAPAALPTAAMMGMTSHVRRLLEEDPGRIWECGAHNMPPMWFPAIGGGEPEHLEIARLLLDAGADPNAHKRGTTALHWAARGGQIEMAELLLSRGARVDAPAKTPQGDVTPLASALKAEKADMAELLRRHGARG